MNHNDVLPKYLSDFRKNKKNWREPRWRELAKQCARGFEAIHFSSAFSMTKPMTHEQQIEGFRSNFRGHTTHFTVGDWRVNHDTLVRDFFTPLLQECSSKHENTKAEIQSEILQGAQSRPCAQGWARALQVVTIDSTMLSRKRPFEYSQTVGLHEAAESTVPWR